MGHVSGGRVVARTVSLAVSWALVAGSVQGQPREYRPPPAKSESSFSPFFDLSVGGFVFDERVGNVLIGLAGGAYVDRLRLEISAALPTGKTRDDGNIIFSAGPNATQFSYSGEESDPIDLVYWASLGWAATRSESFALAPGIFVARTDETAYGTVAGIHFPLDWTRGGARVGGSVYLGRAMAGEQRGTCTDPSVCTVGSQKKFGRPAGTALILLFRVGYGASVAD